VVAHREHQPDRTHAALLGRPRQPQGPDTTGLDPVGDANFVDKIPPSTPHGFGCASHGTASPSATPRGSARRADCAAPSARVWAGHVADASTP
jgi:hypothetical protein